MNFSSTVVIFLLGIVFIQCLNIQSKSSMISSRLSSLTLKPTSNSIVIIAGFEAFNTQLYRKSADTVMKLHPSVNVNIFTDVDITENPDVVQEKLKTCSVLFCSLLFDYSQVQWLLPKIKDIPVKFMFESAQELMSETAVGDFNMKPKEGISGPPPFVKSILKQFGSKKEEDKMAGYLSLLKIGPKVLSMVPSTGVIGERVKDIRSWLTVYSYWNQGTVQNIVSMLNYIIDTFDLSSVSKASVANKLVEAPNTAFYHPDLFEKRGYVEIGNEYIKWYKEMHSWVTKDTPRVGLLLYRKHVLSEQPYIGNLIKLMETQGIMPIPVFITGVEAHIVVRDIFVTRNEIPNPNYIHYMSPERVLVDSIVNTIGFPLVGGPAGSMEGGRQIEVSKEILTTKNVPYFVAAPLLIQDIESWQRNGVQGLQTVILYSLPELDGAIETIVLGGLVGKDQIVILPERVRKLTKRLKSWINLGRTDPFNRKIAFLIYGFPPNVGAVGTAALLNVGRSLRNILLKLSSGGYDIGNDDFLEQLRENKDSGDNIIKAIKIISQSQLSFDIIQKKISDLGLVGIKYVSREVTWRELRNWQGKLMSSKIIKQWGELESYAGLGTTGSGKFLIQGLEFGNIFLGIQPLLGIEGDPMRLLFERDLTPHPQYVAYYSWLQNEYQPHALVHFGMHGTVEWLPGNPLGNTPESWPDALIPDVPNLYIYACNNPSESILAKRRGYATLISHNVPSYSRSGLYNELKEIRSLLNDYRDDTTNKQIDLIPSIVALIAKAGLFTDLPYLGYQLNNSNNLNNLNGTLSSEQVESMLSDTTTRNLFISDFNIYLSNLTSYLSELESKLFSQGLYEIGSVVNSTLVKGYLSAVIDDSKVSDELKTVICSNAAKHKSIENILIACNQESSILDSFISHSQQDTLISNWINFLRIRYYKILSQLGVEYAKDRLNQLLLHNLPPTIDRDELMKAIHLSRALVRNNEIEIDSLLNGLSGGFIPAAPGGDIIRDGVSILPTGRNIFALDPYRIPSSLAFIRGKQAAEMILKTHQAANNGFYPETVAVTLWGLDTIKTKGESVGILLGLVGAEPIQEATGRIVGFQLIPLERLNRPRIDVLASLSGIFRDSFENILDSLDKLFESAAIADEPEEMNYIKKHTLTMKLQGVERPYSRLFSNAPGDFGSMVNERIGNGDWENSKELGDTWQQRNSFSYGRIGEKGTPRETVLKQLLNTTDRIVQEIDCVEYGLTDIQEYYANTGALKKAAENNREVKSGNCVRRSDVSVSVIEATEKDVRPRELEEMLRMEYRTKLLNPKWSDALLRQGSSGAYEISGRLTAMIGWASTAGFSEEWLWNATSNKYAMDAEMASELRASNPEAFRNIVKRLLEASGRGFWSADPDTLSRLQELYSDVEDEIEGVS